MDRMRKITVGGKTVYLCYSIAVLFEAVERYGTVQQALELLQGDGEDAFQAVQWFSLRLSREGAACARLAGGAVPDYLVEKDVSPLLSPWEFSELREAVVEAIGLGYQREIPEEEQERDLGLEELNAKKERAGASGRNTTTSR